jgi:hypothetical protein
MPSVKDITQWSAACGNDKAATDLLDLLAQVQATHWQWRHRLRQGHAAIQNDLDNAVRRAQHIRVVEVSVIPGLLQTPDYARVIFAMSSHIHQTSPDASQTCL